MIGFRAPDLDGDPELYQRQRQRVHQRRRQAHEVLEYRQHRANEAAQRHRELVGRLRPVEDRPYAAALAAEAAPPVAPPAQQPAPPAQQDAQGSGNAFAIPVPARPWFPWNDAAFPPPDIGRPGAMVRRRLDPSVGQHRFEAANHAPHRNGPLPPGRELMIQGALPDAHFAEMPLRWQGDPPQLPMRPLQPADERMPAFAAPPEAQQAQGWNQVGNVNGMPLPPPAIDWNDAGVIENRPWWPVVVGLQPVMPWDQMDPTNWAMGAPPLP